MTSNHKGGNSSSDEARGGTTQAEEKTRLTEVEKKQNHIMSGPSSLPDPVTAAKPRFFSPQNSRLVYFNNLHHALYTYCCVFGWLINIPLLAEQKRRQAIREGFDRLTEIVPGLDGQGRSEGLVLGKTVAFMREQLEENERLKAEIRSLGGTVPDYVPRRRNGN
jgi:septum formation protein